MIFAADTVAVALPDKAVRTHAPAMILLFVTNTVGFLIEGVVLFLGDQYLFAGAANVDEIGLLIVIGNHVEPETPCADGSHVLKQVCHF